MAIPTYLAMTAGEFHQVPLLDHSAAWMACHFSPYGSGLSNLPPSLPPGSLLMLNDRIPFHKHDPLKIAAQLLQAAETFSCGGILLDFQRSVTEDMVWLCGLLISSLPFPVIVSAEFARDLNCPVFLSPCPHHVSLKDHILPWKHREIWLDLAADAEQIHLTPQGCCITPLFSSLPADITHRDEHLHCHYQIEIESGTAIFTLRRTADDLEALAQDAEASGVHALVGLYQEMQKPVCHTTDRF